MSKLPPYNLQIQTGIKEPERPGHIFRSKSKMKQKVRRGWGEYSSIDRLTVVILFSFSEGGWREWRHQPTDLEVLLADLDLPVVDLFLQRGHLGVKFLHQLLKLGCSHTQSSVSSVFII